MPKKNREEEARLRKPYCPECNSDLVYDSDMGETVCSSCGLVVKEKEFDRGPEWKAFTIEEKESNPRVGPPSTPTLHDKGLGTKIDWKDQDSRGKRIKLRQKAQTYRMRKWQRRCRVSTPTERNLSVGLSEISKTGNIMQLPKNVVDTASVIYRKATEERLIRGRSILGVAAGSIYAACRKCGIPRTPDEVSKALEISKKELNRNYRFLIKELDYSMPVEDYKNYMNKFCNEMRIHGKSEEIAHKIYQAAKKERLTSGRGRGLSAAALYIATVLIGEKKTQREISETAGVTEVTIRNRYKDLKRELDFIVYL